MPYGITQSYLPPGRFSISRPCPNFVKFSVHVACGCAQSSSGGVTIRYALPVFWMTSSFHVCKQWPGTGDANVKRHRHALSDSPGTAPGTKSDVYDCLVLVKITVMDALSFILFVRRHADNTHRVTVYVGCMWRPGRYRLSYPQAWPEDRWHDVMMAGETLPQVYVLCKAYAGA